MLTETSLGLTLMILVTIGGNEIAHLVHVIPALMVMGTSLASALWAFRRA